MKSAYYTTTLKHLSIIILMVILANKGLSSQGYGFSSGRMDARVGL